MSQQQFYLAECEVIGGGQARGEEQAMTFDQVKQEWMDMKATGRHEEAERVLERNADVLTENHERLRRERYGNQNGGRR